MNSLRWDSEAAKESFKTCACTHTLAARAHTHTRHEAAKLAQTLDFGLLVLDFFFQNLTSFFYPDVT